MPTQGLTRVLAARLDEMAQSGRLKGKETVIRAMLPPHNGLGPRYLIEGEGETPFLRMNSNSYLGMALRSEVIAAEEETATAIRHRPGRRPFHQRHLVAARCARTTTCRIPSPRRRDPVFVGVRDGHGV